MSNQIIPAMISSWIQEMLDPKESRTSRENRYLMLEYIHNHIAQALEKYKIESNFKK